MWKAPTSSRSIGGRASFPTWFIQNSRRIRTRRFYGRSGCNLRTRQIDGTDYAQSTNPPVLHRKDAFLAPDHPLQARFARLTAQEEKSGLLDNPSGIGTRDGWARRLTGRGFCLKGHRLVKSKGGRHPGGQE